MKNIKTFIMLLAVVPLMMVSCKKESKSGSASNVKFNITDAPADFGALNIDVQSIQVHSTASGWVTLNSSLGVINILSYVNGNATLAAQGSVTAGAIDQIRLVLGSNNSVVVNGNTYSLSAASSAALQSALTINATGQLLADSSYTFTIDFDAAQSVTAMGSGQFQLNPVIRLIVNQTTVSANAGGSTGGGSLSINLGGATNVSGGGTITTGGGTVVVTGNGITGNISGSLSTAGLASVCITGPNGSLCTMTSLTGQFSMQAIAAGTYSVTITPTLSILGGVNTISNVTVTAGQTTNLGVVAM
jgi:hypothetical protein